MNEATVIEDNTSTGTAKVIYYLYLASIIVGITGLIGLIMAYINKSSAPEWLHEHYRYQIRTFWIGFLYLVIGVVTSFVLVGYLILLFWLVWLIIRCVKGLKALGQQQAPENVGSWLF